MPNNCVAHWKLNDNAATDIVIDSAGSNNGALVNGANDITSENSVAGVTNTALSFDGDGDIITVAADPAIDAKGKTEISFGAWIKPAGSGDVIQRILIKHDSGPTTVGYSLYISSLTGGRYNLVGTLYTTSGPDVKIVGEIVPVGVWSYVFATFSTVSGRWIYLNGKVVGGDATPVIAFADDSAEELQIGSNGASQELKGLIDNVMIFDKALSADEVKALYNNGAGSEIPAIIETIDRLRGRRSR